MAEYIEREAALTRLLKVCMTDDVFGMGVQHGVDHAIEVVREATAADVVEVKRGRWIKNAWRDACSICGFSGSIFDEPIHPYNFCPNCGAKMDKKEE